MPEEIAEIALFLGSDCSTWKTGTIDTIDGGNSIAGAKLTAI